MPRIRLTASGYDQPVDYDKRLAGEFDPHRLTTRRRQGEVFDVSDAEFDRLKSQGAAEEVSGGENPSEALVEFANAHLERMREEHDALAGRDGVSEREVKLSEARLQDAENRLARARLEEGVSDADVVPDVDPPPNPGEKAAAGVASGQTQRAQSGAQRSGRQARRAADSGNAGE